MHHATFSGKQLPKVHIHLFLVPLKDKNELVTHLNRELKGLQ